MANNCMNWISVSGADISVVKEFMNQATDRNKEGYGWLPEDIVGKMIEENKYVHYLFDVNVSGVSDNFMYIDCWTKWSPPIEELLLISSMTQGVRYEMSWEESGMQLYGRCVILDGVVVHMVELTEEECGQVQYDDDSDRYIWRKPDGTTEIIDGDSQAYEEMLDAKQDW